MGEAAVQGPCQVSSEVQGADAAATDRRWGALCVPWKRGCTHSCQWLQGQCEGSLLAWVLGLRGSEMRKGGLPPGFGQRLQEALGISYPTRREQWVHPASGLSLRCTRGSREEEATYGYRSSVAGWDVGREKVGGAAQFACVSCMGQGGSASPPSSRQWGRTRPTALTVPQGLCL